jgi:hypothetical protein
MNGLLGPDPAGTATTAVAALATIGTWAYLVGARRLFAVLQLLLAGLATGYLAVVAVHEVLLPRLIVPLAERPLDHLLLVPGGVLVAFLLASRWLPSRAVALPAAVLVGGTAAFAFGGAVLGTLLPQLAAAFPIPGSAPLDQAAAVAGAVVTGLVALSFVHGLPAERRLARVAQVGRWLLVAGIGGWLGFLVVSRLALVVDRIDFVLGSWLGLVP